MNLKGFARDAVIYAFGNVGLRLASLLLTPVYTYCLSVSDYGLWATLQITIQTLLIVMGMGMRESTVRFAGDCERAGAVGRLVGTGAAVVLAGGGLATGVVFLFMQPVFRRVFHRPDVGGLIALTCLAALAQALAMQAMAYYRATRRPGRYMAGGLLGALLLFATTFVAVYVLEYGIVGVLWSYVIAYAAVAAIVLMDTLPRTGVGVSFRLARQSLAFGGPLALSTSGQFVLMSASIYLLSFFAGLEAVAVYSLGWRLSVLMSVGISLPFQLAFQPFLYGNLESPDVKRQTARLLTYLVLVSTASAFGLILGAYALLPVIAPPEYGDAFLAMLLLLPAQAFLGVHYFGETLLGALRRTQVLGWLNSVCAGLCVALNVLLIPPLGWLGAAAASNVSGILSDTVAAGIGMRRFGLVREVEWGRVGVLAALFFGELAVAVVLRHAPAAVFVGAMLAFLSLGVAFLWWGPFCTPQEKAALRGVLGRFGTTAPARAPSP
jgi:O-antigen/teichoic acid export membrane protein